MRLQQYLQEKYYGRIKGSSLKGGGSFEVFVNPSSKELNKELKVEDIMFIADNKEKKIYVWKWNGPFHSDAWKRLKNRSLSSDINKGRIIAGYAEKKGQKFVIVSGDDDEFAEKNFYDKWSWIKNYIDVPRAL